MSATNIIVTGAAGFIGSHVVGGLERLERRVTGTDLPDIDLASADVATVRSFIESAGAGIVIHCAALSGLQAANIEPARLIAVNVGASATLATACQQVGARMVYVSTVDVYGATPAGHACAERDIPRQQTNVYAASKWWGEEACRTLCPSDLQIVRLSMPYGPGQRPGRGGAALATMLWQAQHLMPIPVYGGLARSYCSVEDMVDALIAVVDRGDRATGRTDEPREAGIYNLGRSDDYDLAEIAHMACDITGAPSSLVEMTRAPAGTPGQRTVSFDRLGALGFHPATGLRDGLQALAAWTANFDAEGHETVPRTASPQGVR